MKQTAKLALLFSLTLILVSLLAISLSVLTVWIWAISSIPVRTILSVDELITATAWAPLFSLYISLLLSMNYAARRTMNALVTFLVLFIISGAYCYLSTTCSINLKEMKTPPIALAAPTLGKPGLIMNRDGQTVVVLDLPGRETGPRVVSTPGERLVYQEAPVSPEGEILRLPPVPFRVKRIDGFDDMVRDFNDLGGRFEAHYKAGLLPFAAYTISIILLLTSLSILLGIGAWPIANLFFGALLFRLVLAFEALFHLYNADAYISRLLGLPIDAQYIDAAILGVLGIAVCIYSVLIRTARGGGMKRKAKRASRLKPAVAGAGV